MYSLETAIGLLAAFCTTVANIPQVKKTWQTKRTDDLSLKMLLLLISGVGAVGGLRCLQERCRYHSCKRRDAGPSQHHPLLQAALSA